MFTKNIRYTTKEILEFYSVNRQKWEDFYPSERWILEKIASRNKSMGDVLDVGCACGGLGVALTEKFNLNSYTGVDIYREAIDWANVKRKLSVPASFIAGDILEMDLDIQYDTVISLSCADWNIETEKIIKVCWKKLNQGGKFVISLRLTNGMGMNDINKSYQYLCFDGTGDESYEKANYVVFNVYGALGMFANLRPLPRHILGYGYWNKPSLSARTPYEKLAFVVFAVEKRSLGQKEQVSTELHLPLGLLLKEQID